MKGKPMDGIFVGYETGHGYQWNGLYNSWPLDDFVHDDLSTSVATQNLTREDALSYTTQLCLEFCFSMAVVMITRSMTS